MAGLYIHVPFCAAVCSYCHFARSARHSAADRARFAAGVVREFELRRARCPQLVDGRRELATVYVGGGTPSQLEPDHFRTMIAGTVDRLPRAADCEFTAEANPESFTPAVATAWAAAGVGRVSLGVQSLEASTLKLLGRNCDPPTARAALDLAARTFDRVAADWILGPGATRAGLLSELTEAVARGVEHISLYILELHAGTELAGRVARGELVLPRDDHTADLYLACVEHLGEMGLSQYEVSNFARPGAESRHNGGYWARRPSLALGPAAHGFWGCRRYANHGALATWLACLDEGRLPEATVDPLPTAARRLERVILGLRTRAGVPLDWLPSAALDLAEGRREGLWQTNQGRLALTPRGFLRIDTIEETLARHLV